MSDMKTKRVIFITGGAGCIGRAMARYFNDRDWGVTIADIDAEKLRTVAEKLGPDCCELRLDVSSEEQVQSGIARILERWGRLDALVNNAAVSCSNSGNLENLAKADWDRVMATNLTGPLLCAKHTAPLLRQQHGAIVNIASTRALQSEPRNEAYSASKGGLVALTHALSNSLGPEVRVNCISPGWITDATDLRPVDHSQHPAGRVGRPEDVAAMVEYLVSPAAGFITGQNFIVDGGMTRKMIYAE